MKVKTRFKDLNLKSLAVIIEHMTRNPYYTRNDLNKSPRNGIVHVLLFDSKIIEIFKFGMKN